MKKYLLLGLFVSLGVSTGALCPAHAIPMKIGVGLLDRLHQDRFIKVDEKRLNPNPNRSIPARPKMTQEMIQKTVDAELQTRFDAAADPSTGRLTKQLANDASWGFIADHFEEIDDKQNGYVTFEEVSAFMEARSPLRKKPVEAIQIVE